MHIVNGFIILFCFWKFTCSRVDIKQQPFTNSLTLFLFCFCSFMIFVCRKVNLFVNNKAKKKKIKKKNIMAYFYDFGIEFWNCSDNGIFCFSFVFYLSRMWDFLYASYFLFMMIKVVFFILFSLISFFL